MCWILWMQLSEIKGEAGKYQWSGEARWALWSSVFPWMQASELLPCLHKSLSSSTVTGYQGHGTMLLCFIRMSDSPAISKSLLDQASWLPYHWHQLCEKSCNWAHSAGRGFKQCRSYFSVATSNFSICLHVPCLLIPSTLLILILQDLVTLSNVHWLILLYTCFLSRGKVGVQAHTPISQ